VFIEPVLLRSQPEDMSSEFEPEIPQMIINTYDRSLLMSSVMQSTEFSPDGGGGRVFQYHRDQTDHVDFIAVSTLEGRELARIRVFSEQGEGRVSTEELFIGELLGVY
jgi:hypothetical protein